MRRPISKAHKMHSPKFPIKAKNLRDVINVARLKVVWRGKVRDAMRRQPIPDPLENLDFHTRLDAVCTAIEGEVLKGAYIPNTPTRFLSEKSKGLCRQLVIPSVKDALVLQTLSDALWSEIKSKAPTKKSFYAPGDHQFSKVIKGHSSEYGSLSAWLAFQESIFGFAQNKNFLIVTDIANYYDTISYDHLRNILADLSLAREHALDLLIYTLSCMLWQPDYMPRVPVGLPQSNLDAPRLLAHSFLFEIDEFLVQIPGIDFARYMDDVDIGVDSIHQARAVLRDLDLSLQTRQIRLNSGKTKILSDVEARRHFRVRENYLLNTLSDRIEKKKAAGSGLANEKRKVEISIRSGMRRGEFSSGNGEKVLKRLINLARQTHANIGDMEFEEILLKWPSLRQTLLQWWQSRIAPEAKLPLVRKFVLEGGLVDDASVVDVAVSLVAARLPHGKNTDEEIKKIVDGLDSKSTWSLYAKFWILSKYGSPLRLMNLIESSVSIWVSQEQVSRLVAGLYSRFIGTPFFAKYEAILQRVGNAWSMGVLQFHRNLNQGTPGYTAIHSFLRAPNPSLPNALSHAKFLMLLSLLNNPDIAPVAVSSLEKAHAHGLSDPYYSQWI